MPLIKCENVSLAYENVCVVRNLNFSLEQGDYLCIIGENGSGCRIEKREVGQNHL